MGCDIHLVLEVKDGRGWTGLHSFAAYRQNGNAHRCFPPATTRNYTRFARLAGVRGEGPPPRGLPSDPSDLTDMLTRQWGSDDHSHSWLPVKDAAMIFMQTDNPESLDDYAKEHPETHYFNVDDDQVDQYRLVFWFDN